VKRRPPRADAGPKIRDHLCDACGAHVLVWTELGMPLVCDPGYLSVEGEALAVLTGRSTFTRWGRSALTYRGGVAPFLLRGSTPYGDGVVAEHPCRAKTRPRPHPLAATATDSTSQLPAEPPY